MNFKVIIRKQNKYFPYIGVYIIKHAFLSTFCSTWKRILWSLHYLTSSSLLLMDARWVTLDYGWFQRNKGPGFVLHLSYLTSQRKEKNNHQNKKKKKWSHFFTSPIPRSQQPFFNTLSGRIHGNLSSRGKTKVASRETGSKP